MPYNPENDISENIIHRNSGYQNLNGISCCTCEKCIRDDKSGSLKLYNFKSASPIVNTQSVGSNMIFFSNYMMPSGSFSYIIDPVKTKNNGVIIEGEDFNYASYMKYYPFRGCTGVAGSGSDQHENLPYGCILDENSEIIQYSDVYYTAKFCSGYGQEQNYSGGILGFSYPYSYKPSSVLTSYGLSSISVTASSPWSFGNGIIQYDNFYGNYLTSYTSQFPTKHFLNSDLIGVYATPPNICSDFYENAYINFWQAGYTSRRSDLIDLPDGFVFQACEQNDGRINSYPWVNSYYYYSFWNGGIYYSNFAQSNYMAEFQGLYYFSNTSNAFENSVDYWAYGVINDPEFNHKQKTNFIVVVPPAYNIPSSIKSYFGINPQAIQSGGPTPGFLRAEENGYLFNINWALSDISLPRAFVSTSPNQSTGMECTEEELHSLFNNDPQWFIDHGEPKQIDIGNYQDFFNYCKTHDYSTFGFRIGNSCENNIEKMMHPIYILDLDGFQFPYEHSGYYLKSFASYTTNKFLTPLVTGSYPEACSYKYKKHIFTDPPNWGERPLMYFERITPDWMVSSNYYNQGIYYYPDFKPINEPDYNNFAKGGYILKDFSYYSSDGSFYAVIGTSKSTPIISSMQNGAVYKKAVEKCVGSLPTPISYKNCYFAVTTYGLSSQFIDGRLAYYDYPYKNIRQSQNPNAFGEYIKAVISDTRKINDTTVFSDEFYGSQVNIYKYFYFDSEMNEPSILINGSFSSNSSYSQSVYINYETPCGNLIIRENSLKIEDYIATTGPNTYQTTITDDSGVTTVTIHNALFVGKKLFEANYENYYGNNRPWLSNKTKVPLNYNAQLKGGFECDIDVTFRSVPMCKMNSIPDKLKRSDKLKISLNNYQYIEQPFYLNDYWNNYYLSQNPYANPIVEYMPASYFNNYIFCPPDLNPYAEVFLKKDKNNSWGLVREYEEQTNDFEKTYTQSVVAYNRRFSSYGSSSLGTGTMYGNDYSDDYKSSFYVYGVPKIWETGNKIRINAPKPLDSVFIKNTDYYCIFVKDVKQNDNAINYCQIRIAKTLSDAQQNKYIEIVDSDGKPIYAKYALDVISFTVKYFDNIKEVTKDVVPGYSNFNPQSYSITNPQLSNLGIPFTYGNFKPRNFGKLFFTINPSYFDFEKGYIGIGFSYNQSSVVNSFPNAIYGNTFRKIEVQSLSPAKIVLRDFLIKTNYIDPEFYYYFNYNPEGLVYPVTQSYGYFGFYCDVVIEEVVDENTIPSLPNDFNKILDMVYSIETQQPYQEQERKQLFVIPEKCTHIGKVIDRKNCNCPKKWIRECEIFGTTDWNNCMKCDKFEYED